MRTIVRARWRKRKISKRNLLEDLGKYTLSQHIKGLQNSSVCYSACMVCRRLKMKCVGAEQGPPCKRCQTGGHECIFEESNRGKRSSKKHELLTRSLRKMERTLDTVLRSIGNPDIASGYMSRSPSPSNQTAKTQALLVSPSPPPSATASPFAQQAGGSSYPQNSHLTHTSPGSPKLHSLPDNSLNPLGLLAEASLANRRAHAGSFFDKDSTKIPSTDSADYKKLGVASDLYFKPGTFHIRHFLFCVL